MRTFVFELSGEHDTLPQSEVIACIEAQGCRHRVTASYDQALIVETDADPARLAGRLALTHYVLELIGLCEADEAELARCVERAHLGLKEGQSFVVRVNRVKNYGGVSATFEKRLGAVIWRRGYPVSLTAPDATFRVVVTEGKCIFGRVIGRVDRQEFEERAPLKKPFFLPGVLMPRFSRAAVNLTRIRCGYMLDPFSGTGGTLAEAGLIGPEIKVVGCDIQKKMVYGTRKNLRFYGTNYDVIWQDSLHMGIRDDTVEAIVTDFPYGQSTPVAAASVEAFYQGAMSEMYRVLKPGRWAVVVSKEPMEKLLIDVGFTVIEKHRQRIHKSLTRQFTVIRK